jgi:hypothetical protein
MLRAMAGAVAFLALCWVGVELGWGITPYDLAQSGVLIPLFIGLMFGPVAGAGAGLGGYLVSYAVLFGLTALQPGDSMVDEVVRVIGPNALVAGLIGAVAGIAPPPARRYLGSRSLLRAAAVAFLALAVGTAFLALAYRAAPSPAGQAHPPFGVDAALLDVLMAGLVLPVLLFNASQPRVPPTEWIRSRLARHLAGLVLLSAALPVLLALFLLRAHLAGMAGDQVGATVMLAIVFAVVNAGLVARAASRPLLRVIDAARAMRLGDLDRGEAAALGATAGLDEISLLAQVFGQMAEEVLRREEAMARDMAAMKREMAQLHIEIDEARKAAQVAEVTDTDYFRGLQDRASRIRRARPESTPGPR